jgi:hypothetical protein
MTEIIDEVSKLSIEERRLLFQKLNELELETDIDEETPEMLAAIDEADASSTENDLSAEQLRQNVKRWAHFK